ncbi:flavin reductase family protein [Neorhizobium sp. Rsf11]|uniref:Flavin reductase family protein n=2 Tax=Neorhizobium TaxID=1525371 RepID=A0ABV0ME74_9HYPH|nr:flavin reductase family protein [Neorhizobium petrolearium]MCC2613731.1 flavin reductase family protein [Neorhizobium petrolearium]WGI72043.1 flavin reductase family protein [Neorhizobium petrolearium]
MTCDVSNAVNGKELAADSGVMSGVLTMRAGATPQKIDDRQLDKGAAPLISGSTAGAADADPSDFKAAMRLLAGGTVVVTVGAGDERTGFTATSVVSLSAEPPRLMFGISKTSSSWEVLCGSGTFAVNLLRDEDKPVADRFAGRGGVKGKDRYAGQEWRVRKTGVPTLTGAIAGFDCEVEEFLFRYDHVIVIGRVREAWTGSAAQPLVYWQGDYRSLE